MQSAFVTNALALLPAMVQDINAQIKARDASCGAPDPSCDYLRRNEKAKQVLAVCSMVPKGMVTTYGTIGQVLEAFEARHEKGDAAKTSRKASLPSPKAAKPAGTASRYSRFVGGSLGRNPFAPHVPCHRVVASTGKLNGFAGGLCKKKELLLAEKVALRINSPKADECVVAPSSIVN